MSHTTLPTFADNDTEYCPSLTVIDFGPIVDASGDATHIHTGYPTTPIALGFSSNDNGTIPTRTALKSNRAIARRANSTG